MIFLKIFSGFEHQFKPKLKFWNWTGLQIWRWLHFSIRKKYFHISMNFKLPHLQTTITPHATTFQINSYLKTLLLNQDSILLPLAPQLSPLPLYQPAVYKIYTIKLFLILNSNCFLAYGILHGILKDIPIIQIWHPRDFIGKNPLNFIWKNPLDFISSFFL